MAVARADLAVLVVNLQLGVLITTDLARKLLSLGLRSALSGQVAPAHSELLARSNAPLQTEACKPFSLFSFVTRADPPGRDIVDPVSGLAAEHGGFAVQARI